VTAPVTAAVAFDAAGFTATPTPPPTPVRVTSRASRSSGRAALAGTSAAGGVLQVAQRYFGIAYVYGGTTPRGFDCSGYTGYVFRQVGIKLPRTAHAQMRATTRISRSQAQPGDLVFFVSGGHAYHVGIYAGGNMMYDSPRTGRSTGKHKIWSKSVVFGRP
jgi:cell wall-associated NlpC family hydrolase